MKLMASTNPKVNRVGPQITSELIDEIQRLARHGLTANDIADQVKWPWHCSLRRIRQWAFHSRQAVGQP